MRGEFEFGCRACFQGDAGRVWEARAFRQLATLVDESHFIISVMACQACDQRCVKIFTEFVDWVGGDDAQYWAVVPVSAAESDHLMAQGATVELNLIQSMSSGRPCLKVDYPTGGEKHIHWSVGPVAVTPP